MSDRMIGGAPPMRGGSPGAPKAPKLDKKVIILGSAAAVGGVLWWRQRQANSTVASDAVDSALGDQTTDYYGDEYGQYSPVVSYPTTGTTDSAYNQNSFVAAPTNVSWSQDAYESLTDAGYDGTAVFAALGKYLTSIQLTEDEASIVRAAIAAVGYPPNPPAAINVGPPTGQTQTPSPATTFTPPAEGFYREQFTGAYYFVYGSQIFRIGPTTIVKLKAAKKWPSSIPVVTHGWGGYRLPVGSPATFNTLFGIK